MNQGLGLGSVGNIGPAIMTIIGVGINAIILLTFAPQVVGDVSAISLTGKTGGYCTAINGEAFDRLIAKGSHDSADDAWNASETHVSVAEESEECRAGNAITKAGNAAAPTAVEYYTPQGEAFTSTVVGTAGAGSWTAASGCNAHTSNGATRCYQQVGEWQAQSESLNAGGLGTLVQLLFGAMGILIPAGALGYLGMVGLELVNERIGGGAGLNLLVVVVAVVTVGAILPQIITPLDVFFNALDGNRYYIFSTGIGRLADTIGNFMGIALIAGVITLGGLLFKNRGGGRMRGV